MNETNNTQSVCPTLDKWIEQSKREGGKLYLYHNKVEKYEKVYSTQELVELKDELVSSGRLDEEEHFIHDLSFREGWEYFKDVDKGKPYLFVPFQDPVWKSVLSDEEQQKIKEKYTKENYGGK